MKSSHFLGGLAIFAFASACGPITEDDASPPSSCSFDVATSHPVDPFKELVIVDDAVVESDAAKNATGGALGFAHTMETIAGEPDDASAMTLAWLDAWAPASFTCAWLQASAANACDATCSECASHDLDMTSAPFRLMAVSNRIDLDVEEGQGGEGRLLFAATEGPGDDPASAALPMTVIFEFRLGGPPGEWAAGWHALGDAGESNAQYMQNLLKLTENFTTAHQLAQIRVDDEATDPNGILLEFHLDESAPAQTRIAPATLNRTPPHALDGSPSLEGFIETESQQIVADTYQLPSDMLADRVVLGQRWNLPGTGDSLRHDFASGTCDGCHGTEHPAIDGGFHVSPFRHGTDKLSRFLYDPNDRASDELTRRAGVLAAEACR